MKNRKELRKEKNMEVDDATLHEESAEVQSPKRNVIRVEPG